MDSSLQDKLGEGFGMDQVAHSREDIGMRKAIGMMLVLFSSFSAVCQSTPKYQLGTITNVSVHELNDDKSTPASYDVSLKIDSTIYVVRYTPQFGLNTVKYSGGRKLLVLVGKDTINIQRPVGTVLRCSNCESQAGRSAGRKSQASRSAG